MVGASNFSIFMGAPNYFVPAQNKAFLFLTMAQNELKMNKIEYEWI